MLRNWSPNSSTKDLIKLHCAIDLIDFVSGKGKISTWGKYGVDLNTYIDKIFD